MDAPLFLDRLELISEGYRNGIARNDSPYGIRLVESCVIDG
jgi:hypothetical protein